MRKDLFLDFLLIKDHLEINSDILAFGMTWNMSHVFNNHYCHVLQIQQIINTPNKLLFHALYLSITGIIWNSLTSRAFHISVSETSCINHWSTRFCNLYYLHLRAKVKVFIQATRPSRRPWTCARPITPRKLFDVLTLTHTFHHAVCFYWNSVRAKYVFKNWRKVSDKVEASERDQKSLRGRAELVTEDLNLTIFQHHHKYKERSYTGC